jgi:(p)ppGpp synthase/HD superfamily hydrolase
MSTIKLAIQIAEKAHRKQRRTTKGFAVITSGGLKKSKPKRERYILHPLRVAFNVWDVYLKKTEAVNGSSSKAAGYDAKRKERMTIAAILHDVIEDTDVTLSELKSAGFSDDVLNDVVRLTRRISCDNAGHLTIRENYFDYINRVGEGPDTAVVVKIADLLDNLDGYTIDGFFADASDVPLVKRYRKALGILGWTGREAQL